MCVLQVCVYTAASKVSKPQSGLTCTFERRTFDQPLAVILSVTGAGICRH